MPQKYCTQLCMWFYLFKSRTCFFIKIINCYLIITVLIRFVTNKGPYYVQQEVYCGFIIDAQRTTSTTIYVPKCCYTKYLSEGVVFLHLVLKPHSLPTKTLKICAVDASNLYLNTSVTSLCVRINRTTLVSARTDMRRAAWNTMHNSPKWSPGSSTATVFCGSFSSGTMATWRSIMYSKTHSLVKSVAKGI